jgi:heme a synthase
MTDANDLLWFRRLALAAAALAFVVIVMGAWVRLSAAGLGCPDWPGCYGHFSASEAGRNLDAVNAAFPERPFEYHKAVKEMVHRYFASTLGLAILVLAGLALANRKAPAQPVALPLALAALVIFQGLLGMWTVTLLLKPLVVVLHLLGGLATFSLLIWLAMDVRPGSRFEARGSSLKAEARLKPHASSLGPEHDRLRTLALAALAVLVIQIALGGWTSSNYAALACPDFPTCQNQWWPEMDVGEAFVLWRGLGVDYEGGVLDHPARVAIHFTHRLGAVVTAVLLGLVSVLAWRRGAAPEVRRAGVVLGLVLLVQLILGPVMVMRALPLPLATAHNGVAALLLAAVIALNHALRRSG